MTYARDRAAHPVRHTLSGMPADRILDAVPGARRAHDRIADGATRDAFRELLGAAADLRLEARERAADRQAFFSFGPGSYPRCRINRSKGIAFHTTRTRPPIIIRSPGDDGLRLARGILRRRALDLSLDTPSH